MSEARWGAVTKDAKKYLRLLYRAIRLKPLEAQAENWGVARLGSDWVDQIIVHLSCGDVVNAHPVLGKRPPNNDLRFIQLRLRLAESFHKLKTLRMGPGK